MIEPIRNILYASDMGQGARPALQKAVTIAAAQGAEITYLHVMESSHKDNMLLQNLLKDESMQQLYLQSVQDLRHKLERRIERFFNDEQLPEQLCVNTLIAEGTPWEVIVEQAQQQNADMIVMGTRKHSGLSSFVLGSTARKVMQHADRPVLIVPLD